MDIYVGNLPYSATEEDLSNLFSSYGPVDRVKIIIDRETGRPKGFGFVTLGDQSQLNAAIEALNGEEFQGRALRVNASEPKAPNSGGFSGGDRRNSTQGKPSGGKKPGSGGKPHDRRKKFDEPVNDWGDDRRPKPKGGHREKRRGGDDFGDW